jgi:hypothetical protein
MSSPHRSFAEQVRRTAVAIYAGPKHIGSGFLIQPSLVVTCAHVTWRRGDDVTVEWDEQQIPARVLVRDPPERGNEDVYAFPDLCFIQLLEHADRPFAPIANSPEHPDRLSIAAVTPSLASKAPALVSASVNVAGRAGQYLRVTGDEITSGMSGGPAFDPRTGLVYGVVKASQDVQSPRGGMLIQTADLALSMRRHAATLAAAEEGFVEPVVLPGSEILRELLEAQRLAAERLPYAIVDGAVPPLSTVYVRQGALRQRSSGYEALAPERMLARHRHVLLVGPAGAGKSTLMHYIALATASDWLDNDGQHVDVPFGPVVALRVRATLLASGRPITEAIAEAVNTDLAGYLPEKLEPELFARPPMPGAEWLLLVDGLDEILDSRRRTELVEALSYRLGRYGDQFRFLITSRPLPGAEFARFRQHIAGHDSDRVGEYVLAQFDRAALREFANRWFRARTPADAEERTTEFLAAIADGPLATLLEAPLLATIAALLYETHPGAPLPVDRTGLYVKFVEILLYEKREVTGIRADLRTQFAPQGDRAEALADLLITRTEECLEELGYQFIQHDVAPSAEVALGRLRRDMADLPAVPRLREQVQMVLVTTGLVLLLNEALRFRHLSIAEYFAAGHLAREGFPAKQWVRETRATGITSVASFYLARWVLAGNDATPLVRVLCRPGPIRRYWNLPLLSEILADGARLGPNGEQVLASSTVAAVRGRLTFGPQDAPMLYRLLSQLIVRTGRSDLVLGLATSRRGQVVKAVEASRALLDLGPAGTRESALDALRRAAQRPRLPLEGRCWALQCLAAYGDDDQRSWAVDRLLRMLGPSASPSTTAVVITALLNLDEAAGTVITLLAHAVDPTASEFARHSALTYLSIVLDAMSWSGPPGNTDEYGKRHEMILGIGGRWRSWYSTVDPVTFILQDVNAGYAERLAAAFALVWPIDADNVEALLHEVMRNPQLGWAMRVHIAVDLGIVGLERTCCEALTVLADDPALPVGSRAGTVAVLRRYGDVEEILLGWLHDERQPAALRAEALRLLKWWQGDHADALARRISADVTEPFALRYLAALSVGELRGLATDRALTTPQRWGTRLALGVLAADRRRERAVRRLTRG